MAELNLSPPTNNAKTELRNDLESTGDKLSEELIDRLEPILRKIPPKWDDEERWRRHVSQAKEREPSPDELVQFLAEMTCGDSEGGPRGPSRRICGKGEVHNLF
jgi:hypothetical protein